ncbi:MAG: ScyD/ScyE family protein, partial [Actinobacteria bacterium]|nr:ScyD/ScyE family protein [Actinomycetota bacterium]
MAAGVLGLAVPAGAGAVTVTPVMSGLDNPRGLAFGPDGALYVAESGRGGPGPCVVVMGAQQCAGFTGAVSRLVSLGQQSRIATGLPFAVANGTDASGPSDLTFRGGRAYVSLGLGTSPAARSQLGPFGCFFGHLIRLGLDGNKSDVADVAGYEGSANPDGGARSTRTPTACSRSRTRCSWPTPAATTSCASTRAPPSRRSGIEATIQPSLPCSKTIVTFSDSLIIRTVADWHPNAPSTEGVVGTSTIGGRGVWRDVATSGLGSRNDAAHTYSAMPGIAS